MMPLARSVGRLLASVTKLRAKRSAVAVVVALAAAAGCRRAAAPSPLTAAEAARLERHAICLADPPTAARLARITVPEPDLRGLAGS